MSKYSFYIVDPVEFINRSDIPAVAGKVTEWLDPIAKKAGFDYAYVCFPQFIAMPQPHEIMVYICSFEHSVVQLAPGAKGLIPNPMMSPHKGITLLGPPAASEIYVKESNPLVLASLIFHEAMHNKLQSNNSMHSRFSNPVMSAAYMDFMPDIAPSAEEHQAMINSLKKPVNQWTEGQQILWDAAKNKKAGDELHWDDQIKYRV